MGYGGRLRVLTGAAGGLVVVLGVFLALGGFPWRDGVPSRPTLAGGQAQDRSHNEDASRGHLRPSPEDVDLADEPSPARGGGVGRRPARTAATPLRLASVGSLARPPALEERRAANEAAQAVADAPRIVADFEGCAPLKVTRVSASRFAIDFEGKFANWFMFRVEGAKGRTLRIDLDNVDLAKWHSLNPVYSSIAALDDPDGFASRPTSLLAGKPDATAVTKAYNGPLLPATDGIQQWHYISEVWADWSIKRLSLVHTFADDRVYVAMRVPYTPGLAEAYIARLEKNPLAKVITVGKSKEGRPLRVVKIGGGSDEDERNKPCILMYAREHGNEQDSSWAAQGAIDWLLSDAEEARSIRGQFTVLLIPLLDPDGAARGLYENLTHSFAYKRHSTPEPIAYAAFFRKWIDAGQRLDVITNLHNVESAEQPHVSCALMEPGRGRLRECQALHQRVVRLLEVDGFVVSPTPWKEDYAVFRLGGFLSLYYGPLHLPYEVNSQDRGQHLTLWQIQHAGRGLLLASAQFLGASDSHPLALSITRTRQVRLERIDRSMDTLGGINDALTFEYFVARRDRAERAGASHNTTRRGQ